MQSKPRPLNDQSPSGPLIKLSHIDEQLHTIKNFLQVKPLKRLCCAQTNSRSTRERKHKEHLDSDGSPRHRNTPWARHVQLLETAIAEQELLRLSETRAVHAVLWETRWWENAGSGRTIHLDAYKKNVNICVYVCCVSPSCLVPSVS